LGHFESRVVDIVDVVGTAVAAELAVDVVDVVDAVDTAGIAVAAELAVEAVGDLEPPVAMGSAMRIFGADVRVVGGDPSCLRLYSSLFHHLSFVAIHECLA